MTYLVPEQAHSPCCQHCWSWSQRPMTYPKRTWSLFTHLVVWPWSQWNMTWQSPTGWPGVSLSKFTDLVGHQCSDPWLDHWLTWSVFTHLVGHGHNEPWLDNDPVCHWASSLTLLVTSDPWPDYWPSWLLFTHLVGHPHPKLWLTAPLPTLEVDPDKSRRIKKA